MKTTVFTGFLGLLLLLLGGSVLFYDGSLSALIKPSGFDSIYQHAGASLAIPHLLMSPVIGWFVIGTGAVLTGLKLHEGKLI